MHQSKGSKKWEDKPTPKYLKGNSLDNALVVMDNKLARVKTNWTLEETKLFFLTVSQFPYRDKQNNAILPYIDTCKKLGIDSNHYGQIKILLSSMVKKSVISFDTKDGFEGGTLFTNYSYSNGFLNVRFNDVFNPLFDQLKSHFTSFYVESVLELTHKSSVNLYVYLTSWSDFNYFGQHQVLLKKDIEKVFNLSPGQYWREYGTEKQKFDWGSFEKRCLYVAINELNKSSICDIDIRKVSKIKEGRNVIGYQFDYVYVDKNGHVNVEED